MTAFPATITRPTLVRRVFAGAALTLTLAAGSLMAAPAAQADPIAASVPSPVVSSAVGASAVGAYAVATVPAASASTTEQEMRAMARRVDPSSSATWTLADRNGNFGEADLVNNIAYVSRNVPDDLLFEVMTHEFAHLKQGRAFGGGRKGSYNAKLALDALVNAGRSTAMPNSGLEYSADCMTDLAGGKRGAYGCQASVKTFSRLLASGSDFSKVQGRLDSATASGQTVTVTGWSFDPIYPTRSNPVVVTVNGKQATLTADGTQAAVNSTYGVSGRHAYRGTISGLAPGKHQVCATGRTLSTNAYKSAEPTLGCRTVTVTGPQAKTSVDAMTVSGRTITVRGWSYDPRNSSASNPIQMFVDGTHIGSTTANTPRADVNKAFGIRGNHGFSIAKTVSGGKHTVCVRGGGVAGSGSTWAGQTCSTMTLR